MSARDLLQRRTTESPGKTDWEDSPLVRAARLWKVLVLDGLDRVDAAALTVVQRLVQDRDGPARRAPPARAN